MPELPPDYPWSLKAEAFLHDPLHKALVIGTRVAHEGKIAHPIARAFGVQGEELAPKNAPFREADRIASAADRELLSRFKGEVVWPDNPEQACLTHPLGGEPLWWKDQDLLQELKKWASPEGVAKLRDEYLIPLVREKARWPGWREKYLWLWGRYVQEAAQRVGGKLGPWLASLPADTRHPDHTLWQHLSMTAALAAALVPGYKPSFLLFSIGPVQSFIQQARRTADLWIGSWLLSWLIWQAMQPIIQRLGPDAIIFPSLRGHPWMERYLKKVLGETDSSLSQSEVGRIASLPNRFLALVPWGEEDVTDPLTAQAIARAAEEAVRTSWECLVGEVWKWLESKVHCFTSADKSLWEAQVKAFPEITWTIFPWPGELSKDSAQATCRVWEALIGSPLSSPSGFPPNWGTYYGELYALAEKLHGTHKATRVRAFPNAVQIGESSSLNAEAVALRGDTHTAKSFWAKVRQHSPVIKPGEILDALGAIRRFLPEVQDFSDELGASVLRAVSFPSNSEIAAAPFKKAVWEQGSSILQAVRDFLTAIEEASAERVFFQRHISLPFFRGRAAQKETQLIDFLRVEGSWLYEVHWEEGYLRREGMEVGREKREKVRKALRELYEAVAQRPTPYYAVLVMDGDYMGRWLSGTHPDMPSGKQIVHPALAESGPSSSPQRRVTPAYHAFISEALGIFSRQLVPQVVEQEGLGVVVYAGGDDVLAFVPVETVLRVALKLRAAWSGFLQWTGTGWEIDFSQRTGYLVGEGGPQPTMGPKATASIGISIAHHRQPLELAIRAAREAEAQAKKTYNRDAVVIQVLKRSGDPLIVGARWGLSAEPPFIVQLLAVKEALQSEGVSLRLGKLLQREIAFWPQGSEKALLRRFLRHRDPIPSEALLQKLESLYDTLAAPALRERPDSARPIEVFAKWLELLHFISVQHDD